MQQSTASAINPDEAFGYSTINFGLATTQNELEQAFELVWQGYTKVGLQPSDGIGARITKYHLLPTSKVFIATSWKKIKANGKTFFKKKVIGTLTVAHDGCLGLPAENVCKNHIVDLRRNGEKMTEIIGFACNEEGMDKRVSLKLFCLAYEYCAKNNVTGIIASLTKRHIGYYRRFLGFSPLGELSKYALGNNTPVQVHYGHVESGRNLFEKRTAVLLSEDEWKHFWENRAHEVLRESIKIKPWSTEQMKYFISRCPNLLDQINISDANALSAEYQRYNIELDLTP